MSSGGRQFKHSTVMEEDSVVDSVEGVFTLYNSCGDADYIGEPVSMLQHALQAAYCAQLAKSPEEEVLGALLHDVGHMIGMEAMSSGNETQYKQMDGCGVMDHENIGAEYLRKAGFSRGVVEMCRGHVAAKRYLCFKNSGYLEKLSDASKVTLGFQGGPMLASEAKEFEANPYHLAILRMRSFDEAAKVPGKNVPGLDSYRQMMITNITSNLKTRDR